ncbi:hypothetical protein M405DRAFT_865261 [Rhizopogon salebrosus TDB-379]|nr:hypothetical protein M405DRAFT_865261 [Rhizopogon salebrosus TDB-379]
MFARLSTVILYAAALLVSTVIADGSSSSAITVTSESITVYHERDYFVPRTQIPDPVGTGF